MVSLKHPVNVWNPGFVSHKRAAFASYSLAAVVEFFECLNGEKLESCIDESRIIFYLDDRLKTKRIVDPKFAIA